MIEAMVGAAMVFAVILFFICMGVAFLALTVWIVARLLRSADKTRPRPPKAAP